MEPDCSFDELARRLDRLESRVEALEADGGGPSGERLAEDVYRAIRAARLGEGATSQPSRGRA